MNRCTREIIYIRGFENEKPLKKEYFESFLTPLVNIHFSLYIFI
jgi:hypothetical protein